MGAMDWFLFQSHKGYCEFFATAMGDMLRSLGIPARLVNGFGPGVFDSQSQSYVVRGQDAHTWVEVYFPAYGWIPFEPTKDGTYTPISRGQTGLTTCLHDSGCDDPGTAGSTGSVAPVPGVRPGSTDSASAGSQAGRFPVSFSDPGTLTKVLGLIIALVLLVFAGVTRYLRPRSVMGVWKRTLTLARLAGAERPPGETPMELGRRLQREFPEAADSAGSLASGFAVAAYAPPELASSVRGSVFEAWSALRPILLRRVLARLRPY
ncbi:MAG: transglutaminase domain-containing protein [Chloroflexi bacterium]|nr:MAG: transglutaminase domain-containing protein [Chloroflexota bacterium]